MKQLYALGQKVYVFRTQKGEVSMGQGIIHLAEINTAGYIQYSVKVFKNEKGSMKNKRKNMWNYSVPRNSTQQK